MSTYYVPKIVLGIEDKTSPCHQGTSWEEPQKQNHPIMWSFYGRGSLRFDENTETKIPSCQAVHGRFPNEMTPGGQVKVGGQDVASLKDAIQPPPEHLQSLEAKLVSGEGDEGSSGSHYCVEPSLHPSTLWSWFCSPEKQNESVPSYLAALKIFANGHHRPLFLYLKNVEIV